MRIQVTAEHIAKGVRENCECCPVALALRDCGFPEAKVGTVSFWPYGNHLNLPLPREVSSFIRGFDAKAVFVFPFSFELDDALFPFKYPERDGVGSVTGGSVDGSSDDGSASSE